MTDPANMNDWIALCKAGGGYPCRGFVSEDASCQKCWENWFEINSGVDIE